VLRTKCSSRIGDDCSERPDGCIAELEDANGQLPQQVKSLRIIEGRLLWRQFGGQIMKLSTKIYTGRVSCQT
jgi:hypothetical protein